MRLLALFVYAGLCASFAGAQAPSDSKPATNASSSAIATCEDAMKRHVMEEAVPACKLAVEKATEIGDKSPAERLALMQAHVTYGRALAEASKLDEALAEENTAVDLAKKYFNDSEQEYGEPIFWRGVVQARRRDMDAAMQDVETAEAVQRKAIAAHPERNKELTRHLAKIMMQHAYLLDRTDKQKEAWEMRNQANALVSSN